MEPLNPARLPPRSAYLRPATLRGWSAVQLADWAARAVDRGVEALVTKLPDFTDDHARICARAGLSLIGSFTCYAPHAGDPNPPGTTAIDDRGLPLEPVEWYTGLVPGDPGLEDARAAALDREVRRGLTDTMVLDFLRWPGHWETESRHGAEPRASSFDQNTLARFVGWADSAGVDAAGVDPHDPIRSARVLRGALQQEWQSFRTRMVTGFAARLARIAHDRDARVGAFLVPVPPAVRRRDYGQDAAALAVHLDLFVPMTYHSIAGEPVDWIGRTGQAVTQETGKPVIAMVQLSASPHYSGGWDWGRHVPASDLASAVDELEHDIGRGLIAGHCLFPGEAIELAPATPPRPTTTTAKGTSQ
jgi:hypothetical protein